MLQYKIKASLQELHRSYSEAEFEKALRELSAKRITMSGVDFELCSN